MRPLKGGLQAAFFFILVAISVFDYGKLFVVRIGMLRISVFCIGAVFLWKAKDLKRQAGVYTLLVGGFVLLAFGHAFSSVYPWASFQHAVNIALASALLGWAYLLCREDPEGMWKNISFWIPAMAIVQLAIAGWQRVALGNLRPNGTFDNTNFLAEFLAVSALLCLSVSFRREETTFRRASALAGAVAFLAGSLSLSASRGVLLAFVPALAFLVISRFGWRRGGKAFLFLLFPLLLAVGAGATRRFMESDPYTYGRLLVWKSAALTFVENPFGIGLGGFKYLWFEKQFPVEGTFLRYGNSAVYAHNEYLDVLVGLGAPGLLVFLAVLLYPLAAAARSWKGLPEERKGIAAVAVSGLLVAGIHACFDFNFHEIGLVCLAATLAGLLLAMLPEDPEGRDLLAKWQRLREIRALVQKQLEALRQAGAIGSSLQAEAFVAAPAADKALLESLGEDLRFVLITSTARLESGESLAIRVEPSAHAKCERCWHYRADVGGDAAHPTICGRCVSNLFGAGEVRSVA
jgi:O-antigen ligase